MFKPAILFLSLFSLHSFAGNFKIYANNMNSSPVAVKIKDVFCGDETEGSRENYIVKLAPDTVLEIDGPSEITFDSGIYPVENSGYGTVSLDLEESVAQIVQGLFDPTVIANIIKAKDSEFTKTKDTKSINVKYCQ